MTEAAIKQYHDDGFFFPVRAITGEEATGTRRQLEAFEAEQGNTIGGSHRNKSHLLFTCVDALMRNATVLDAVEDLIGPNILC